MSWYYAKEGRQIGPVTEAELQSQVTAGAIRADTLVWREGMAGWQPYAVTIGPDAGGAAAGAAQGTQVCSQCGRVLAAQEMIRHGDLWVCAACKPAFVQGLQEGTVVARRFVFGGFWIRLAARLIDGVILWIAGMLIQLPVTIKYMASIGKPPSASMIGMQMLMYAIQIAIGLMYEVLFIGRYGATPGKMACGLKVVQADGGRVGYARALARYFSTWVSSLTLGIGFVMAGFDDEKRTLHDRICDTRVVKR